MAFSAAATLEIAGESCLAPHNGSRHRMLSGRRNHERLHRGLLPLISTLVAGPIFVLATQWPFGIIYVCILFVDEQAEHYWTCCKSLPNITLMRRDGFLRSAYHEGAGW